MITLVVGGSASGKSEYAEQLALGCAAPRWYVATMEPQGAEAASRIARHRAARAGRGFVTLERSVDLAALRLDGGVALLECMGNLVANELFSPDGAGEQAAGAAILQGVKRLAGQCDELVIVTNDIFADGAGYDPGTVRYLRLLAQVNRALAALADQVAEVVCGIPIWHKGGVR